MSRRLLVVGLDCAPPRLVFDRYRGVMPYVDGLMRRGSWGPLRSCTPPITVPAWACMTSGKDPGELGIYGFRQRQAGSYALRVASSADVRVKRLWDRLGEAGKHAAALFVPLTWPPTPVNGEMVSCCLTPNAESAWAYPAALKDELQNRFGAYRIDLAADFRRRPSEELLPELRAMAEQHFAMARHIAATRQPDFLMMVEIGVDRLHHVFWQPGDDPLGDIGARYYAMLDAEIAALHKAMGQDAAILVVSDHGARSRQGGWHINRWLMERGWLRLRDGAEINGPLLTEQVDWSRTRAWAEGGYYSRLQLNVQGREPQGSVPAASFSTLREELRQELRTVTQADGKPLSIEASTPQELYRCVRGEAPDLLVFIEDLAWRALGTLDPGNSEDGNDGCNHDWQGIAIWSGSDIPAAGEVMEMGIEEVAPRIERWFGLV